MRLPLLVTSLTLLCSTPAQAGDYSRCTARTQAYPADGATGVPLNALLVQPLDVSEFRPKINQGTLATDQGQAVQLEQFTGLPGFVCGDAVLKPQQPLQPNMRYHYTGGAGPRVSFTTGSVQDTTRPMLTLGGEQAGAEHSYAYHGSDDIVAVYAQVEMDLDVYAYHHVLISPVAGKLDLSPLYRDPYDEVVTLKVYDRAGNMLEVPFELGLGGCGVARSAGARWPLLAGLLLACWLRRRGQGSSSRLGSVQG